MFKIGNSALRLSRNHWNIQGLFCLNSVSTASPTPAVGEFETELDPLNHLNRKKKFGIVEAAFASLKSPENTNEISTPFTDDKILKAQNVNELLSISSGNGVSRSHALKVVSVLSDWTTDGKAKLSDFETDPRFIRLCRVLTRNTTKKPITLRSEDLSTVIGITADDEAAKLIDSISLPQMIKVMSVLTQKRRRSTPLLRSLAFNLARIQEQLNLKQSADLLFSITVLNYPDSNLLGKIITDVCANLKNNTKGSAVVGSILTSLGLLRYKDCEILDALSDWILKNKDICRMQDIFALFHTLATVNYTPLNSEQLFEEILPLVRQEEVTSPIMWLEFVWSLVLCNKLTKHEFISSVLQDDFLEKIEDNNLSAKLKLLNIDSASKFLVKDYKGPQLSADHPFRQIVYKRSKEKEKLVNSVLDTLSNLFSSKELLRTNVDTKMGFFIDAECAFDSKGNPISFKQLDRLPDGKRIALLVCDYYDMCHGRMEPNGIMNFYLQLLQAQGYKVVHIPYAEFIPNDKLLTRVKYLQLKLKPN